MIDCSCIRLLVRNLEVYQKGALFIQRDGQAPSLHGPVSLFGSPATLALCFRPVDFASPPFDGFAFIVEVIIISPVYIYHKF